MTDLERYSGTERARVHAAILDLSHGSPDRLRHFVDVALRDYRDVLHWVESAEPAAQTGVPLSHLVERAAIELVERHDLDEIESLLIAEGAARALTPRLVLLVPSAFARDVFGPQGIAFPEMFLTPGEGDAGPVEHSYLDDAVYLEARTLARRWMSDSREGAITRILEWSAEARSIEEARKSGLTPSRVGPVTHDFRVMKPEGLFTAHLRADIDPATIELALADWRWLIGDRWSPIVVSAVGDIFLTDQAGVIARLDTGVGTLEPVASSLDEFRNLLADPTRVDDWFLPSVVDELRQAGQELGPVQCYGFTILPIFAQGSYAADNRFILDILEHIRFTGETRFKLNKGVPDGAAVEIDTN